MNVDKLARMANQIAANLGPNKEKAVAGVADHLLRFWTPAMRAELARSHSDGTVELTEIAALGVAATMRPGAKPESKDTGGDAG